MASIINSTTTAGVTVTGDNSGSLQLATNNGTTAVTIDTSQNLGIGTASPSYKLHVANGYGFFSGANYGVILGEDNCLIAGTSATLNSANMVFFTANNERMRIDSSGALLIGTTSAYSASYRVNLAPISTGGIVFKNASTADHYPLNMLNSSGSSVGYIESSNTAVSYVTSSDYRLKENIAPMIGALAKVAQLKPVTYDWKVGGSSQGFIAHELQSVVPDCVTGEKDAVDEEGNPVHQGVDTSFLVATLTSAIQELKAELDATKAEVQALKGTL